MQLVEVFVGILNTGPIVVLKVKYKHKQ